MELLLAALLFYFVIKHAVKKAIIEAKVEETELTYQVKNDNLIDKITLTGYDIIGGTQSKEIKEKAKVINEDCFKISMSSQSDEEKFTQLKVKENEMVMLRSEVGSLE